MVERIAGLEREFIQLKAEIADSHRRVARVERVVKSSKVEELSKRLDDLSGVLTGEDGKNGMQKSVNRLLILVDGSKQYNVVGLVDQIDMLRKDVEQLVQQRNRIKWAAYGVLAVTTLGNARSIFELIMSILS